jgi:NADH:ubiquinone oxidoreductase subunit K
MKTTAFYAALSIILFVLGVAGLIDILKGITNIPPTKLMLVAPTFMAVGLFGIICTAIKLNK